jgi:hypothetical protein
MKQDNIDEHKDYFFLEIEENGEFRLFDYSRDNCASEEKVGVHNFNFEYGFPGYKKLDDITLAASRILQLNQGKKLRIKKAHVVVKTQKVITEKQEHVVCCMTL